MLSCAKLSVRNSTSLVWVSPVLPDAATRVKPRSRLRGSLAQSHPSDDGRRWTISLISFCGSCIIWCIIQGVPILGVRQLKEMSNMGGANGNYTRVAHVYIGTCDACADIQDRHDFHGSSPTKGKGFAARSACRWRVGNYRAAGNSETINNRSRTRIKLFTDSQ